MSSSPCLLPLCYQKENLSVAKTDRTQVVLKHAAEDFTLQTRKLRLRIDSVSKDSMAVKAGHQIRLQQQQPCLQFGVIWGLCNGAWSTFVCHLMVSRRSCRGQTQMWAGDRGGGGCWGGFGPACSPFCLLLLGSLVGLFVYRWALPTPAHHGLIGT